MKRHAVRLAARVAVGLGWTARARRRRQERGDHRIFILEYHRLVEGKAAEGQVRVETFRRHLAWLVEHFELITVRQAAERLRSGRLESDALALTFDDGYADNAELAFPALRAAGVPATIYLATAFLDGEPLWFDVARRALAAAAEGAPAPAAAEGWKEMLGGWPPALEPAMKRLKNAPPDQRLAAVAALAPLAESRPAARPMSWAQARELEAAGIELGAHTVHHPILARLDKAAQRREIAASRERLDQQLGPRPRTFAMPNGGEGDYDPTTLELLAELGFVAACTTRRGSNSPGGDLYQLRRLGVGDEPVAMLEARLAGLFDEGVRRRFGR